MTALNYDRTQDRRVPVRALWRWTGGVSAIMIVMEKDGQRYCDLCGQPIPKMSKLALCQDGKDVCLACQIREAERQKGLGP